MTITTFAARVKRLDFFAPKLTINLLGEEPYNLEDFETTTERVKPLRVTDIKAVLGYLVDNVDALDAAGAYLHLDSQAGTASVVQIVR